MSPNERRGTVSRGLHRSRAVPSERRHRAAEEDARRLLCFYKTEMTPCTGIAERAKEREIEGQSERSRVL